MNGLATGPLDALRGMLAYLEATSGAVAQRLQLVIAEPSTLTGPLLTGVGRLRDEPSLLLFPTVFALGVGVLLSSRTRPTLAERLQALDVEARLEEVAEARYAALGPAGVPRKPSVLGRLFGPLLDDLGQLVVQVVQRLGPGRTGRAALQRDLRLVHPGRTVAQQYLGKALVALTLGGLLVFAAAVDLLATPFWLWLLVAAAGFWLPDVSLDQKIGRRRRAIREELPLILDHLGLALSGLSLEQALREIAGATEGTVADELKRVVRTKQPLDQALAEMDQRNNMLEMTRLATVLAASYAQGGRAAALLADLAGELRTARRTALIAASGKAAAQMGIPIGLFMMPTLTMVLLVPAVVQVTQLTGGR